jgi:monoamine oxidase
MQHSSLTRRRFLGLSVVAGFGATRWTWAQSKRSVLIIGGGIAGLAAAKQLTQSGYKVTILEARDRIGGRIHTAKLGGNAVDLGAQWIEGIDGNPLMKLCRQMDIRTRESDDDNLMVFDADANELDEDRVDRLYDLAERLMDQAAQSRKEMSVAKALAHISRRQRLSKRDQRILEWIWQWEIGSSEAEDLTRLSWQRLIDEDEPDGFEGALHVIPGGFGQITHGLARGLDVRLKHVVSQVTHNDRGVVVTTDQGEFRADQIIITLPLGVLKKGSVVFDPPLPESKRGAIARLGFGAADKVVLKFPRVFWPRDVEYFGYVSDTPGQFVEWVNVGGPILSVWNHGDFARGFEKLSDREAVGQVMVTVRRVFGKTAPPPTDVLVTRWHEDAYSRGAYSNLVLGSTYDDFDELARPIGKRVYFAGEATSRMHYATAHGAYLTGLRAAGQIGYTDRPKQQTGRNRP